MERRARTMAGVEKNCGSPFRFRGAASRSVLVVVGDWLVDHQPALVSSPSCQSGHAQELQGRLDVGRSTVAVVGLESRGDLRGH